jgi:hypothetical protein
MPKLWNNRKQRIHQQLEVDERRVNTCDELIVFQGLRSGTKSKVSKRSWIRHGCHRRMKTVERWRRTNGKPKQLKWPVLDKRLLKFDVLGGGHER